MRRGQNRVQEYALCGIADRALRHYVDSLDREQTPTNEGTEKLRTARAPKSDYAR